MKSLSIIILSSILSICGAACLAPVDPPAASPEASDAGPAPLDAAPTPSEEAATPDAPIFRVLATGYATPGPYYNAAGLVGVQSNPFAYDPGWPSATPDHAGNYATQTVGGTVVFGRFMSPIRSRGGPVTGYGWIQCGQPGAGC